MTTTLGRQLVHRGRCVRLAHRAKFFFVPVSFYKLTTVIFISQRTPPPFTMMWQQCHVTLRPCTPPLPFDAAMMWQQSHVTQGHTPWWQTAPHNGDNKGGSRLSSPLGMVFFSWLLMIFYTNRLPLWWWLTAQTVTTSTTYHNDWGFADAVDMQIIICTNLYR